MPNSRTGPDYLDSQYDAQMKNRKKEHLDKVQGESYFDTQTRIEAKKRKDKVKYYETPEGQSQYVIERQGEYDYSPDDGMASGGIARMLGE